jgi:hypothetical protein
MSQLLAFALLALALVGCGAAPPPAPQSWGEPGVRLRK